MTISLIFVILSSILGTLFLIYFWLRHLRTDLISHIDKISSRLDKHIDEAKNEGIHKHDLIIQLNTRMDKLYNYIIKKISRIP
jgi:hypothetical protein